MEKRDKLPVETAILWAVMLAMTVVTIVLQHYQRQSGVAFTSWATLVLLLLGWLWCWLR